MKSLRIPSVRMGACLLFALLALAAVALIRPSELGVIVYKVSLVSLAAVGGYWLDYNLFPYARPSSYLTGAWRGRKGGMSGEADFPIVTGYHFAFCAAMARRAIVIGAAMLAVGMGL